MAGQKSQSVEQVKSTIKSIESTTSTKSSPIYKGRGAATPGVGSNFSSRRGNKANQGRDNGEGMA